MKIILSFFIALNFLFAIEVKELPKDLGLNRALYINCLQRTQTQQLLKDYILIVMHLDFKNPKKELSEGIEKYEKRIIGLDNYFKALLGEHPEKEDDMKKALSIWNESKVILKDTPSKDQILVLKKNFKDMIHLLASAKVLSKKSFKEVGLTGGLCREPLYVANLYFMKTVGVEIEGYDELLKKHRDKFNKNISILEKYEGNTEAINKEIKAAKKSFFMMNRYIDNSKKTFVPALISGRADKIFVNIRTIKKLYGEILKKN